MSCGGAVFLGAASLLISCLLFVGPFQALASPLSTLTQDILCCTETSSQPALRLRRARLLVIRPLCFLILIHPLCPLTQCILCFTDASLQHLLGSIREMFHSFLGLFQVLAGLSCCHPGANFQHLPDKFLLDSGWEKSHLFQPLADPSCCRSDTNLQRSPDKHLLNSLRDIFHIFPGLFQILTGPLCTLTQCILCRTDASLQPAPRLRQARLHVIPGTAHILPYLFQIAFQYLLCLAKSLPARSGITAAHSFDIFDAFRRSGITAAHSFNIIDAFRRSDITAAHSFSFHSHLLVVK